MTYPLTPVPYGIAIADGYLVKTDKAKGLHHITKDFSNTALTLIAKTLTVLDGNACFYLLRDLPSHFNQICSKLFDVLGKTGDVVFNTDRYF